MTRETTVLFAICLGVLAAVAGCGDESAAGSTASLCAQMCGNVDDCPNVYWQGDCMADCENALDAVELAGGACPEELDDLLGCQAQLSCGELSNRANGGFYDDECVARERRLLSCESRSASDDDPSDDNPGATELELACAAFCETIDDCPGLYTEPNCVQLCAETFGAFENGAATCSDAIVDAVNCQSSLSCSDLGNRVGGGQVMIDSCTDTDRAAEALCF